MEAVVALWPGPEVSHEVLDGEGFSIEIGGRVGEIMVNSKGSRVRQRFTLAHAIGHWLLALVPEYRSSLGNSVERWCDDFAGVLLIPRDWLIPLVNA
jgi:Zn-dependent peptidase ImmA (M78 family)